MEEYNNLIKGLNLDGKEERIYKDYITSSFLDDELSNVELKNVKISDLIPTQNYLSSSKIKRGERIYKSPVLIKEIQGKYYIIDGHHRIYLHYWNGEDKIKGLILHLKNGENYSKYNINFPEFAKMVKII